LTGFGFIESIELADKDIQTGIVGNLKKSDIPAISQPHAQVNRM